MPENIFDRLGASNRLPSLPAVVVRLLELTRDPNVAAADIAETIGMDPALAAKVLRFVNSPAVGLAREVTSLQQAVTLVGTQGIKMMALSLSVLRSFGDKPCPGFDQERFALMSIGCGVSAKVFCALTKSGSAPDAFLTGLLSQIGRSALAHGVPDEYSNILTKARIIPFDLPELELKAFGESYATVGAWLLKQWYIPDTLCDAVAAFRCVDTEPEASSLAKLLYVTELAAGVICADSRDKAPTSSFLQAASKHLSLSGDQCMDAIYEIVAEIENIKGILELSTTTVRSIEDIEAEVREQVTELQLVMQIENRDLAV